MSQIIDILAQKISAKSPLIEDWFAQKFQQTPANFYNSVDLRHSGFKIAPIDTNCFPAGFNNLCDISKDAAKIIADKCITDHFPQAKNILIAPENHTRNMRYLENVAILQKIIQSTGRLAVVGSLMEDLKEKMVINLDSGKKLTLNPLIKNGDQLTTGDGFAPDLIILNNDLTGGIPSFLQDIKIPITPSLKLGWYQRTKSHHFTLYNDLAIEFAAIIDIDPWLISSMHRSCHDVNFKERTGIKCLAKYVDELMTKLKEKYREYGINEDPYCYMKADNGTYGMAVMPVFSSADILDINKKERNKMNMLKESTQNTMVMIQEGIKTIDKIEGKIAEPMIYMIGGQIVGNLFRANDQRNQLESLNASGAAFFDLRNLEENQIELGSNKKDVIIVYSVISRLAALAAAQEDIIK
ncbi:MAG: glutamate--cysteine ligase [Rickettsiales bacterium]|nr:glutamate--cysteine ligase [Rickettsiales bacterium]